MEFVVIDYLKGNLMSVKKGLESVGANAEISSDPDIIRNSEYLVLPGVGSFTDAMQTMNQLGITQAIKTRTNEGAPFLGICLGIQLLFEYGEEGVSAESPIFNKNDENIESKEDITIVNSKAMTKGLGIIEGTSEKMSTGAANLKIPHVGFNSVEYKNESELFNGIDESSYFYFTHSFIVKPTNNDSAIGLTTHGNTFVSAIQQENIFGVQFHPEKSSKIGLKLLKNFVDIARSVGS